mgnify:CR=1 FL=1
MFVKQRQKNLGIDSSISFVKHSQLLRLLFEVCAPFLVGTNIGRHPRQFKAKFNTYVLDILASLSYSCSGTRIIA